MRRNGPFAREPPAFGILFNLLNPRASNTKSAEG